MHHRFWDANKGQYVFCKYIADDGQGVCVAMVGGEREGGWLFNVPYLTASIVDDMQPDLLLWMHRGRGSIVLPKARIKCE